MAGHPFANAFVLTGPTGSGKTALGLELAERLGAEIISMDSMALYRRMDIGTAKPGRAERARVEHHLVDVLEPWESSTVAWWLDRARRCYAQIGRRGRRALFVGGTALYLQALLFGIFECPPADPDLRRRLADEAADAGAARLHERLARVDPLAAARIHENDLRRVVRALEVWELTGRPISAWQRQWPANAERERSAAETASGPRILCIDLPRDELYARIDDRVARMVRQGLEEEVRGLLCLRRPPSRAACQAVGYKEMLACVSGRCSHAEAVALIRRNSRRLAKRQLTWFRRIPGCVWASPELTLGHWGSTMC